MADREEVTISLKCSEAQALVLFEWLCVLDRKTDNLERSFTAEEIVFIKLHGQLESTLVAPFERDYMQQVQLARQRVIDTAFDKALASSRWSATEASQNAARYVSP